MLAPVTRHALCLPSMDFFLTPRISAIYALNRGDIVLMSWGGCASDTGGVIAFTVSGGDSR